MLYLISDFPFTRIDVTLGQLEVCRKMVRTVRLARVPDRSFLLLMPYVRVAHASQWTDHPGGLRLPPRPFSVPGPIQEATEQETGGHVSSGASWLWPLLRLALFLMTVWGVPIRYMVGCPSVGICLILFSWFHWDSGSGEDDYRSATFNPSSQGSTLSTWRVSVDADLDHLAAVKFIRFLHFQVALCPPPVLWSWDDVAVHGPHLRSVGFRFLLWGSGPQTLAGILPGGLLSSLRLTVTLWSSSEKEPALIVLGELDWQV